MLSRQVVGGVGFALALVLALRPNLVGQRAGAGPSGSCTANGVLPGEARQGGYHFEYRSAFTQSSCAEWVATNKPSQPDTPYRWTSVNGNQILLEGILTPCTDAKRCEAQAQRSFAPVQSAKDLASTLGWGQNQDQYHSNPLAYQEPPTATTSRALEPLRSGIAGVFAVPGGVPTDRIALDIQVTSSYLRQGDVGEFSYTVLVSRGPEQLRLVTSRNDLKEGFAVVWGSASGEEFVAQLKTLALPVLALSKDLTVRVLSNAPPQRTAGVPLELYFNETRVAASLAPAYRPNRSSN